MIEFVHDRKRRAPPPVPPTPAKSWWILLLSLGCAVVVYLPAALGASLLGFDDNFYFGPDNPEFQSGVAAVFAPSRPIANAFLPVAHLSLWLDWKWSGSAPLWPHLHALLLHAVAGFVWIRFALQLGASRAIALWSGVLFLVHPALAESVAWVSGRKDLLSGLFTFTALLQCAHFARSGRWWRLLPLALCAALAMYSKATAVIAPLLAVLVCLHVRGPRRRWLAPLVLLAVTAPIAWHHQAIAAGEGTLAAGSVLGRANQVPGAFLHYLATAFWPTGLNVLYPEVATLEAFGHSGWSGLAALVAVPLSGLALVASRAVHWRLVGVGLAAFVVALLPFNTAFPASAIAAADRYLYLAVPGLALALVATLTAVAGTRGPALAAVVAVPLAWLAGGRAHAFADDATLWQTSLATDPDNAVAHLNLVYDRMQRGASVAEARQHLEAAAKVARYPIHELRARLLLVRVAMIDADYPRAATQARAAIAAAEAQLARESSAKRRAEAELQLLQAHLSAYEPLQLAGDDAAAQRSLEVATQLASDDPDVVAFRALRDLAALAPELAQHAAAGQPVRLAADDARALAAEASLAKAQEAYLARQRAAAAARCDRTEGKPHAGLSVALAEWLRARDKLMPALRHFQEAQQSDPTFVPAWLGAARLVREQSLWERAEHYARMGLAQRPDPALRQELALALVGQGRLTDAEQQLEAYVRVRPDDKDTKKVLSNVLVGRAYLLLGNPAERETAIRLVERALAYNPDEARAHVVLGRLAKEARQFERAAGHLERATRQMPDFAEARVLWCEALASLGYERLLQRDEDGAVRAWRQCVAVAPADFATEEIRAQLTRVWQKYESQGVAQLQASDQQAAAKSFRRCLEILPDQHWAAWLLATACQGQPDADLDEIERLCRLAVAWQQQHGLDRSRQVLLLASTLAKAGRRDDGRRLATEYLQRPDADAKPQVLQALQVLAGG